MEREFSTFHPTVIFMYFAGVIGLTIFSLNPIILLIGFIFGWIYSVMLLGKKAIIYQLLLVLPVFLFMVVINPLFYNNGETILFYINNSRVTFEAVAYGVTATMLFLDICLWFRCCGVFLTSDKLIYLFGRIVPSLALMISMVFRFIPLLQARYGEITYGQMGMGRCRKKESLPDKFRRVVKQVSILIAWSLEASIETADSMEARGYGLKGRTSFHIYRFTKRDAKLLFVMLLFFAGTVVGYAMGRMEVIFYPKIVFQKTDIITIVSEISYALLLFLPIGLELEGVRKWKQYSLNM